MGIVAGTLGVAGYRDAINRVRQLVRSETRGANDPSALRRAAPQTQEDPRIVSDVSHVCCC